MNNRDFSNIGEEIRRTVEDAMNSTDYRQLNQKINQTVNMAMDEARRQFGNYRYGNKAPYVTPPNGTRQQAYTKPAPAPKTKIRVKAVGRISGIVLSFIGGAGTMAFVPFTIGAGLMMGTQIGPIDKAAGVVVFMVCLTALLISLFCLVKGSSMWTRYLNFKKYLHILDGREFCTIDEIAHKTNQPVKKICKRLKNMIEKGMFRDGFVDEQETCLIVTNDAYKMYCQAQEARKQREMEETQRKQQADIPKSAIDDMIQKGDYYIKAIREANDAIPGEIISAKLDRLEMVVRKIFESVKKHPEQMDEMDKFMEYYLPTTEKLVNAYKEFDALPVKGENVTNSMKEIENTLDTISHAFEQLLDDLFMDAAFDISSDISVLQTMLAREGYKEKDFK